MRAYEAPKMTFDKLELFEKIACDDCWDSKKIKFDYKKNDGLCPIYIELNNPMLCSRLPCNEGDPMFSARSWVAEYFKTYTLNGFIKYTKWLKKQTNTDFPATGKNNGFEILQS